MSLFQSFSDSILSASTSVLTSYVLPTIVNHYREKYSVESSVEDLLNLLKISSPVQPTMFQPNLSIGLSAPVSNLVPSTTGRKKATTTKAAEVAVAEGEGCVFKFTRKTKNKDKGEECGAVRIPGSNFCKLCAYKKTGGGLPKPGASSPKVPAGLSMTQVPIPNVGSNVESIEADPDIIPGFFVEESSNIVFQLVDDSDYYAFGKINESKTVVNPLSSDDCIKASTLGMKTYDSQEKNQILINNSNIALNTKNSNASQGNAVPQMSQMSAMPMIPQIPQMSAMPMIPQIPQMSAMPMIPQIPQMGTMPMIPQMSQMSMMPQMGAMPQMPKF